MKILIVDKSAKIPATKYGGTERVIWGLGNELVKLGHKVSFLVNKESSSDFAKIIPFDDKKTINDQIPGDIDIVHLNHAIDENINKPFLITMHGNPGINQLIDINTVFISKNQAKRYNSNTFVYNGLDWSDYPKPVLNQERKYLHFLGRAPWKIKNVFGAAKIAIKSDNKLHILGGDRWTFRNFKRGFKYILNPNIIFRGMVDNSTKMNIMKNSKGLIFPVIWHEPFGLAIIESLYAGCAVFGSKNGSLEELITPQVGYTSNNSNELAKAIKEFDYNPKICYEYAVNNFNSKIMTEEYIKLYDKVLSGEKLNSEIPEYIEAENIIPKFI
ncbi:glycosyltransferase [Aquimarina sp. MMG016]|uniref:glycosyltransferase n=1 Tax=Aquimarina sp. MMG016 TaxID=2822690 RepID=UPI001B3A1701|nr:glycosyltransferase [Aquimarina sp. MMG016]MBQ4820247.1 glycosyltransferase [Aquimarina sp. MMG016]